jgi:hypothetical protein
VTRRWLYVVLALLSASLFAVSVWIGQWWSVAEVQWGPLGTQRCFNGDCRSSGLSWTGGSDLWERSAVATWVAGLVAMTVLMGLAAGIAAGRVPKLFARTTLVSIATALVVGAYFALKAPEISGASLGQGMVLFAIAIVAGLVPAIRVLRA